MLGVKTKPISTDSSRIILTEDEKFDFVKTSVSWIEGEDIMNKCFVLNFGYNAPVPWPQVGNPNIIDLYSISKDLNHKTGWRLRREWSQACSWNPWFECSE